VFHAAGRTVVPEGMLPCIGLGSAIAQVLDSLTGVLQRSDWPTIVPHTAAAAFSGRRTGSWLSDPLFAAPRRKPVTTVTNVYRVVIHAQTEAVFAYSSDLTRHPEWSGGHLSVEALSPGPVAVGNQYVSHGDVPGQKDRPNQLRVTEYQPPSRFAFIAQDPGFGDVVHEFRCTPQDGGTLLERTVTLTLTPLMAFAFRTVIQPLIGKPSMDKALATLKTNLEQPGA
jgi:uncharacterized protein YndB with AHSA1/START domain